MIKGTAARSDEKSVGWRAEYLIVGLIGLALAAAVQWNAFLNHDVAWFTWGADRMLDGAVLGRDLIEPNFPLAYLIYVPAAIVGSALGLSAGLKLWILVIMATCLSMSLPRLERPARLPFLLTFVIFFSLAMPREAGQREQIALLLVLPYCLPKSQSGWRGVVVGAMAGIGFAIKPHFLLAWIFVELWRKPLRIEQLALIATGASYAISILIFFREFAFDMLPVTQQVYSAFNRPGAGGAILLAILLSCLLFLTARYAGDRTAKLLAAAAAGFTLAAFAQQRLYPYQMLPAWGFLTIGAALLLPQRKLMPVISALLIIGTVSLHTVPAAIDWWRDREGRASSIPELLATLNGQKNFMVLSVHPFPAFPTAVYTPAKYIGLSNSHWFLPAVAQSGGANRVAADQAVHQAITELAHKPNVVIVDRDWRRHTATSPSWNGLRWLLQNPILASQWSSYRYLKSIQGFDIYVRIEEPRPAKN